MEILTYQGVVDEIFSLAPTRRGGLEVMEQLLQCYGNPHLAYPTIHVAGTNGKGQVCGKVAKALELGGYRVGLYTSPHLYDYSERIAINGVQIPHETVTSYWTDLKALSEKLRLSLNFFECSTIFGFRYFAEKNIDIAVIETGLGGKRDSTNVVKPLVSAITTINFDHLEYLGDSLEEISWQKAGIIKPKTPVVVGPRAYNAVVAQCAQLQGAPIVDVQQRSCYFDMENRAIAREILKLLSDRFPIHSHHLEEGMEYWQMCRLEKRGSVIYDVAHNPEGFERLAGALSHLYPNQMFRFVIGMCRDKDIAGSLRHIIPICEHVHFVQADAPRAADPLEIAALFEGVSTGTYCVERSVAEGIARAKASLKEGQLLVVCGSFYIMRD